MEKRKIPYESPRTELTQVELENPICSGSVEIQNPDKGDLGRINEQNVNSTFDASFGTSAEWEKTTN